MKKVKKQKPNELISGLVNAVNSADLKEVNKILDKLELNGDLPFYRGFKQGLKVASKASPELDKFYKSLSIIENARKVKQLENKRIELNTQSTQMASIIIQTVEEVEKQTGIYLPPKVEFLEEVDVKTIIQIIRDYNKEWVIDYLNYDRTKLIIYKEDNCPRGACGVMVKASGDKIVYFFSFSGTSEITFDRYETVHTMNN